MPHNKEIDDLEYLAEQGYALEPQADLDLPNLKAKIRAAGFSYEQNSYTLFFIALIGAFVGISIFFSMYKQPDKVFAPSAEKPKQEITVIEKDSLVVNMTEVEVLAENFVKPKLSTTKVEVTAEIMEPASAENLSSVDLHELPTQILTEQKLKFIVNSPVFYIHDLKVTNYALLYFKRNRFVATTGLSANYSDVQDSKLLREAPEVWLHDRLAEALMLYKKRQYTPCILALNEVAEYNDEDLNCDFYRGMSYYQLKSYVKAIPFLEKCIEASNNVFLQEASYYKALALREQGKTVEAKLILKQISEEGEFYSEKAKELLKKDF